MAGAVDMSGLMLEPGMEERDSHVGGEEGQLRGFARLRALAQCSALNWAVCAPPRGHLEMFGDIFSCQYWGRGYHGV